MILQAPCPLQPEVPLVEVKEAHMDGGIDLLFEAVTCREVLRRGLLDAKLVLRQLDTCLPCGGCALSQSFCVPG